MSAPCRSVLGAPHPGTSSFPANVFMSSAPTSSSNIQSIFDAALSDYSKQTGIDLATYPFAQDLQDCRSADDLLNVLQDRAKQFQTYRDGSRKLINCLKPVVRILHTLSGFLAEATAVVSLSPVNPFYLINMFTPLASGSLSTHESHFRWYRCSLRRACQFIYLRFWSDIIVTSPYIFQAAIDVSASYDAMIDLFECIGSFLDRLRIYTEVPFSSSMSKIVIKIMVEVLSILSLATKQIKEGRLSKRSFVLPMSCQSTSFQRNSRRSCWGKTRSKTCSGGWTDSPLTRRG
jgi:fungal STAND N-terminal Goodbye domain